MGLEEPYGFNAERLKHLNPRKMKWNQNCVCASQISTSFFGSWLFDHPNGSHQQPLKRSCIQTPKGSLGRTWTSSFFWDEHIWWGHDMRKYCGRKWNYGLVMFHQSVTYVSIPIGCIQHVRLPNTEGEEVWLDPQKIYHPNTVHLRRYDWKQRVWSQPHIHQRQNSMQPLRPPDFSPVARAINVVPVYLGLFFG